MGLKILTSKFSDLFFPKRVQLETDQIVASQFDHILYLLKVSSSTVVSAKFCPMGRRNKMNGVAQQFQYILRDEVYALELWYRHD